VRFHALACDYDETLATDGRIPDAVLSALEDLKRSGRSLILVTGRTLEESRDLLPVFKTFSRVILENGALLYRPATGERKLLAHPPSVEFLERLKRAGVSPLHVGSVIAATRRPH
jgi:HAD superfamily hydrolase (TIGR01484 family)